MQIEVEYVKSQNDITAPILNVLVSRIYKTEDGTTFNELDMMSGDSIRQLLLDSIDFYLHEVKWKDKKGNKIKSKFCKIPVGIKKQQKYIKNLYDDQSSYKKKKDVMLKCAWDQILISEGLNNNLKGI